MRLLLPFPLASSGLFVFWLLLTQSLSPGQVLFGAAIAVLGGWGFAALDPPHASLHRIAAIIRLIALVVADIVRSNLAVALIILGLERRRWDSGFVEIPLELHHPYGLVVLASIITATPGTVWVDFNSANGTLTIHVLDLVDKADWIRTIKGRYEQTLLEIFE